MLEEKIKNDQNFIIPELSKNEEKIEDINFSISILENLKGKSLKEITRVSRLIVSIAELNCKLI